MADLAGVSADYYTQLERGDIAGASDSVLNAVARALPRGSPTAGCASAMPPVNASKVRCTPTSDDARTRRATALTVAAVSGVGRRESVSVSGVSR